MRIDVHLVGQQFDWLTLVAPGVVFLAGLLAFGVGVKTVRTQNKVLEQSRVAHAQQTAAAEADRLLVLRQITDARSDAAVAQRARDRSEWWARVSWAVAESQSDEQTRQELGTAALAVLVSSPLAGQDERQIINLIQSTWDLGEGDAL